MIFLLPIMNKKKCGEMLRDIPKHDVIDRKTRFTVYTHFGKLDRAANGILSGWDSATSSALPVSPPLNF